MKNLHMMHAEDSVISGNTQLTYDMLYNVFEFMQDKACYPFNLTIKYDGSPAIFVWSNFPGLDKPGIATKGLFNKTSVIYTKEKDIIGLPDDLSYKLKTLLKFIPKIPKNEIWQGDFLFDDKMIKHIEIDGQQRLAFHPNTIVYVVPKEIEKQVLAAKIGIVWHTRYTGKSLDEAHATYDFDEYSYKHKKCPEIFMIDAGINGSHLGYFSPLDLRILEQRFHRGKQLIKNCNGYDEEYKQLILNEEFVSYFKMYQNFIIKERCEGLNTTNLEKFIIHKFKKEEDSRKSEKGKQDVRNNRDKLLSLVNSCKHVIEMIIMQINNFTAIKDIYIKKFNEVKIFDTYIQYIEMRPGELHSIGQEGFALSDEYGNVVKLVDREEFSYANFSPHILKGWTKNI